MMSNDEYMMERLPHYRTKYDAAKKIHVYYIPARDLQHNTPIYFYAIASSVLHDEMLRCLKLGDIPYFAAVVEKGQGTPTEDVKDKIKRLYGFDHDALTQAEDPSQEPAAMPQNSAE